MRRAGLIVGLALLTTGGAVFVAPARPSCKPAAPIDLEARLVGDPSAPFAVTARASSRAGGDVELEIVLPDGVDRLGGDRVLKGRRCEARVDARAKDGKRREILVRATTVHGGATLTKVASLVLFDGPVPARGTPKKNSRGEAILEFAP